MEVPPGSILDVITLLIMDAFVTWGFGDALPVVVLGALEHLVHQPTHYLYNYIIIEL